MLTSVEGVYRNGRVELIENPQDIPEGTSTIVTFLKSNHNDIDLASRGINIEQAKAIRASLATFSDDWNSPEMSIYDKTPPKLTVKRGHRSKYPLCPLCLCGKFYSCL